MTLDFVIAGFPKCGTTSLYHWLKQHPDIFMPQAKEPHYYAPFLSDRYCRVRDRQSYDALFSAVQSHQVKGEASVLYAYYPQAIAALLNDHPNAKVIVMLRDPVLMVPSYHGQMRLNLEESDGNFETAWRRGDQGDILTNYGRAGALGAHCEALQKIVPSDQLQFVFLEDMACDPAAVLSDVLSFLKIRPVAAISLTPVNEAQELRSVFIQRWILNQSAPARRLKAVIKKITPVVNWDALNKKRLKKKTLSASLQSELQRFFYGEKEKVRKVVGRLPVSWQADNDYSAVSGVTSTGAGSDKA